MKNLIKNTTLTAAIVFAAFTTQSANAQTVPITADVTVQNLLTVAAVTNLNWGVVAAVGDTGQTASITVATDGTPTVATTGGGAVTALVDTALVTAAQISVEDGANGAAFNVDIPLADVVNPTDGTDTFTLGSIITSYNGGADAPRVIGTPWTQTFDSAFGGGVNTLDIGATLTTIDPSVAYGDGAYAGGFNVEFSY